MVEDKVRRHWQFLYLKHELSAELSAKSDLERRKTENLIVESVTSSKQVNSCKVIFPSNESLI